MTDEERVKRDLQGIARTVKEQLPAGYGFVVLAFAFGPGETMQYVSNAGRADVAQVMREFIAMTAKTYAQHQGEMGKEGFNEWWDGQLKRPGTPLPFDPSELNHLREWCYDAYVAGIFAKE